MDCRKITPLTMNLTTNLNCTKLAVCCKSAFLLLLIALCLAWHGTSSSREHIFLVQVQKHSPQKTTHQEHPSFNPSPVQRNRFRLPIRPPRLFSIIFIPRNSQVFNESKIWFPLLQKVSPSSPFLASLHRQSECVCLGILVYWPWITDWLTGCHRKLAVHSPIKLCEF